MKSFSLRIVTPDGEIYNGEAQSITVKALDGDAQILAGHADYFSPLNGGRVKLVLADNEHREASSSGGFISVKSGSVEVVFTTFEYAENIDVARAKFAKDKAEALLAAAKDEAEEKRAKAKLSRALCRINVAESIK